MSRRTALRLIAAAGAAGAVAPLLAGCASGTSSAAAPRVSVATWVEKRGPRYLVAHRGSGDVYPEHSMPAYQAAVDSGAECLEVSVVLTSDGIPVCMHDLTLDRTTTGTGLVRAQTSADLARLGILQPQLGPKWTRVPLPGIPRLSRVFDQFGRSVVYCLDAKDPAAYAPMLAMADRHGLRENVIVKAFRGTRRIQQAQTADYPVFVYLAPADMTEAVITQTAHGLRPTKDYLVIPATTGDDTTYFSPELIRTVVALGVPTWVYPVHRRADLAYYHGLGVVGAVSSSYAYTAGLPPATRDAWAGKAIVAGEITRHPADKNSGLTWTGVDELTLAHPGGQQFVTMGQFCPLVSAAGRYTIGFSARWPALPADAKSQLQIAFAAQDDTYYEHRSGTTSGYHAFLQADGRLKLYRHDVGVKDGIVLGDTATAPPAAGQWMRFRLDVTPEAVTWTRQDDRGASVTSYDRRYRGGYFHLGRTSSDGQLSFRQLGVT